MTSGDCPQCGHSRCFDCDVKSHVASPAEKDEENKKLQRVARGVGSSQALQQPRGISGPSEPCETPPGIVSRPQYPPISQ